MDDLEELQGVLRPEEKCNHCIRGNIVRNLEKDRRLLGIVKKHRTAALLIYHYDGETPMAHNLKLEYALPINKEFSVSVDIAIGAWQSDRVLLLRTRPVMDLAATLTLSRTGIPVDNFTRNCPDNKTQCLNATACFSYIGKSVTGQHEIQYTLNLDSEITSKGSKRVYFPEDPKYERTGSLNLTAKNVTSCVDFPFIHIVKKDRLTSALNRGTTTAIAFTLNYELISPPNCETDTLCAILDKNKPATVTKKATLVLNCSDNICDHNLKVKISADKENITIGKTNDLLLTIDLSNDDEVSYNPEVLITYHDSMQFEKITVPNNNAKITRTDFPVEREKVSKKFTITGPLNRNEKVTFIVHYSTSNVDGEKPELPIVAKAFSSSGQEKDPRDNNATISVFVKREVMMEITGTSVPKGLSYPSTAPALNIVGNDYSRVNVSSVGPSVETTFELTNTGASDLKKVKFTVSYPLRKFKGKEHEYIVYPIAIKVKQLGTCKEKGVLNPANLNLATPTDSGSGRRRKRAVETLEPRTTTSGSFVCEVEELKKETRFTVSFEFRLWTASLAPFYAKDLVVKIEARAEYIDSLSKDNAKQFGVVEIRVSPENPPGKSKSTPVWIIIVAILGGVLLLAIAILALFKLGFFKRNRPPQDISSPQTDETPAVLAT